MEHALHRAEKAKKTKREKKAINKEYKNVNTWSGAARPYSPPVARNLSKPSNVRSPLYSIT